MFAVMNVVRMDHPLQIAAAFGRAPSDALVNNDVVKNEVKNSVAEYAKPYGQHVRIIINQRVVIEKKNRRNAEDQGKEVVAFQWFVVNSMM